MGDPAPDRQAYQYAYGELDFPSGSTLMIALRKYANLVEAEKKVIDAAKYYGIENPKVTFSAKIVYRVEDWMKPVRSGEVKYYLQFKVTLTGTMNGQAVQDSRIIFLYQGSFTHAGLRTTDLRAPPSRRR